MGLGQYDSLEEYCSPHTASSVFIILVFQHPHCMLQDVPVHTMTTHCKPAYFRLPWLAPELYASVRNMTTHYKPAYFRLPWLAPELYASVRNMTTHCKPAYFRLPWLAPELYVTWRLTVNRPISGYRGWPLSCT